MAATTLLLSGGIDSMVVLHLLKSHGHEIHGLFVNYGQNAAPSERISSKSIATEFGIEWSELTIVGGLKFGAGEIRHRNAMLAFLASMEAPAENLSVAIGIHGGVPYSDCSTEFLAAANSLMCFSSSPTRLLAPLQTWVKKEVIAYAVDNKLPLKITYSCETDVSPCGLCLSCLDRAEL